jgi:hypothetical protein
MKTREQIITALDKGVWEGLDYSVSLAASKLTVELLIDIRDLLEKLTSSSDYEEEDTSA